MNNKQKTIKEVVEMLEKNLTNDDYFCNWNVLRKYEAGAIPVVEIELEFKTAPQKGGGQDEK